MVKIKTIIQIITYGCVGLGFATVAEHLERIHLVGFLCLCLLAVACERRRVIEIPRRLLNGISLGVLCLAVFRITPETLIEPILDALVILAAVKLLEDKKIRDYLQIYLICLFLLVGSTLISLSIVFLLTLSLYLMLVTTALILLAFLAHNPELTVTRAVLGKVMVQSLLIFSVSLPLSVLLFVILPRTAYPFLTFLNRADYARSGFSDTIALGQVAAIQEDNAAIFRAEMEPVEESRLFWRGIVLDRFDGLKWTSGQEGGTEEPTASPPIPGQAVVQTIYLEPYGNRYLFALDKPMAFSVHRNQYSRTRITPFKTKIFERMRYTATSWLADRFPEAELDRDRYLALPEGFAPEVLKLVQNLVWQQPQAERVKSLVGFLRRGVYAYSLEDLPVSEAPLESFLFVHKRGNCEYFASSLAVMLRMAGVPARLIGGYKGGHYNRTGKYYLVTQRNAHVWVEAYLSGFGWLRLDPTPPGAGGFAATVAGRVFVQLGLLLDTFNYYWYKVIIDYDFTRQVQIVNAVRERMARPDLKLALDPAIIRGALPAVGIILGVSLVLWVLLTRHRKPEDRIISKFLDRMAAHGYAKQPHEGLEEFVQRVDREELRARARVFIEDFEQITYRDREFTREMLLRLKLLLKGL